MSSQVFDVLYEDQDILLVEKKKAFISQRAESGNQEAFFEFISRALNSTIYPVHRLDREVLGLMIFGKTKIAAESLSAQFKARRIRKSYSAWIQGRLPEQSGRLVHYLMKNSKTNYTTVFPRPTPGAKEAILDYETDCFKSPYSRVSIQLETGRSHQIRAQLAKMGCPIVGDRRYAKSKDGDFSSEGIHLKSVRLGFLHPQNGSFLEWKLPPIPLLRERA